MDSGTDHVVASREGGVESPPVYTLRYGADRVFPVEGGKVVSRGRSPLSQRLASMPVAEFVASLRAAVEPQ
jgi:hypothetical protein